MHYSEKGFIKLPKGSTTQKGLNTLPRLCASMLIPSNSLPHCCQSKFFETCQPCLKSLSGPKCFQDKIQIQQHDNHVHNWPLLISPASSSLLLYTAANILSWICNSLNSECSHSSLPLHKPFPCLESPLLITFTWLTPAHLLHPSPQRNLLALLHSQSQ